MTGAFLIGYPGKQVGNGVGPDGANGCLCFPIMRGAIGVSARLPTGLRLTGFPPAPLPPKLDRQAEVSESTIVPFWGRTGFDLSGAPEAACRGRCVGLVNPRIKT